MSAKKQEFKMDGYNDVPSRIAEFRTKYPDGRLRPADPATPFEVREVGGKTFIVYVAAAHRDADDELPGIGCAWEPFPGPTPYTKDSELQNAETSAWGRAIVAALAADTRTGVASAEEIRNRQAAEQEAHEATVDLWPYIKSENEETGVHMLNTAERAALTERWKTNGYRFGPGAVPTSREQECRTLIDSYVGTHPDQPTGFESNPANAGAVVDESELGEQAAVATATESHAQDPF